MKSAVNSSYQSPVKSSAPKHMHGSPFATNFAAPDGSVCEFEHARMRPVAPAPVNINSAPYAFNNNCSTLQASGQMVTFVPQAAVL